MRTSNNIVRSTPRHDLRLRVVQVEVVDDLSNLSQLRRPLCWDGERVNWHPDDPDCEGCVRIERWVDARPKVSPGAVSSSKEGVGHRASLGGYARLEPHRTFKLLVRHPPVSAGLFHSAYEPFESSSL